MILKYNIQNMWNVYGKNLQYEIHVLEKKNITGLMTELKEGENKIVLSDG